MKRKTLTAIVGIAFLAIYSGFTANAQITITESDMPQIGNTYVEIIDTIPTVTPGAAGASQTWNFSAIKNGGVDSDFALAPSSTPYGSDFPTSNLAVRINNNGAASYEYNDLTSGALRIQGTALNAFGYVYLSNNAPTTVSIAFPATYKSHWSGSYRNVDKAYIGSGDSLETISKESYYDTIDAWGSVTTPIGVFNSLRVNETFTPLYDSTLIYSSGLWFLESYTTGGAQNQAIEWLANGKYQVAELIIDTVGKRVSSASYLKTVITGIDEINDNADANVYPNPASALVNIVLNSANQTGIVKVLDVTGREVETSTLRNGRVQLNTINYNNGIYLYLITDMNGNIVDKGKFCVTH